MRGSRSAALTLIALAACGGRGAPAPPADSGVADPHSIEVRARELQVGWGTLRDGRVAMPGDRIPASEEPVLSVLLVGQTNAAVVVVRWLDSAGRMVGHSSETIWPTHPTWISLSPGSSLLPGTYRAELLINGRTQAVRDFSVISRGSSGETGE